MKLKQFGNSFEEVSAIGQGCMGVGGYLATDASTDEHYIKMLRLGIHSGMTFIDTAEVYGNGHSEEVVGKAIKGIRHKVFIATKFSPENNSYDNVIRAAERSLSRLQVEYIDLYQIHWPNPQVPIEDTLSAMEKLVKDGKIRHIGLSNFSCKDLKNAIGISKQKIASIQMEYNLLDRSIEKEILPYCEQNKISVIAYSPLNQGRANYSEPQVKVLKELSFKYEKTVSQILLKWIISNNNVIAIPKATSEKHVKENADACNFTLTKEDFEQISKVFAYNPVLISTEKIRVIQDGQGNRQAYSTVEEAIANKLGFVPSPEELSKEILNDDMIKPIRVKQSTDSSGRYSYDLIEGRIRYWAWVIAYGNTKCIPALVCD